jgi:hypothetical protein
MVSSTTSMALATASPSISMPPITLTSASAAYGG